MVLIRSLCVGVANISCNHDKQLSLFDNNTSNKQMDLKEDKLQSAIDCIRNKYGDEMIGYADVINKRENEHHGK